MKLPRWLKENSPRSDDDINPNPNLINVGLQVYVVENPPRPQSEAASGPNRPIPNRDPNETTAGPSRPISNPALGGKAGRTKDFGVQVELPPKGKNYSDKGTQTPKGTGDLSEASAPVPAKAKQPDTKPPDAKPPAKPPGVSGGPGERRDSPEKPKPAMKPAVPKPVPKPATPPASGTTAPAPAAAAAPASTAPALKKEAQPTEDDSDDESSDVDSITKKNTNMNKVTPPPKPLLTQPEKKAPTGPRRGIRGIKNMEQANN